MLKWNDSLTHWGRVTHICVSKLTIIGSDNGLSPSRCQAIIWTNSGILLSGTLWINFSGIVSEIHTFSLKKMHLKMSSVKCRPFCLGLNVLTKISSVLHQKWSKWPLLVQPVTEILSNWRHSCFSVLACNRKLNLISNFGISHKLSEKLS